MSSKWNDDETLTMLVYGDTKVGKSTFAATCPGPILVLDVENGMKFVGRNKVYWRDLSQAPPKVSEDDVCIATVRDWKDAKKAVDWIEKTDHGFRSIVIDSVTELQQRLKDTISKGDEQWIMTQWGELLRKLDPVLRHVRDLTFPSAPHPVQVVLYTAGAKEFTDDKGIERVVPSIQGSIAGKIAYFMDTTCYLAKREVDGARILKTTGTKRIEAYSRIDTLPDTIENPSVTEILNTIYKGE